MSRIHFGQAGHFIGAPSCRFHLHTHVNGYCVSTVGDYRPMGARDAREIGSGRMFETMVFKLDGEHVTDWGELDCAGYNDRDAANLGHEWTVAHFESQLTEGHP